MIGHFAMSFLTTMFIASEALTWSVGAACSITYSISWMRFRDGLNREVEKRVGFVSGQQMSSRHFRYAMDLYVKSETGSIKPKKKFSARNFVRGIYRVMRDPKKAVLNSKARGKKLRSDLTEVAPNFAASLGVQETSWWIGSTALEVGAAFIYSHLGGDFLSALVFTMPTGSLIAIARRLSAAVFIKRRINILRRSLAGNERSSAAQ